MVYPDYKVCVYKDGQLISMFINVVSIDFHNYVTIVQSWKRRTNTAEIVERKTIKYFPEDIEESKLTFEIKIDWMSRKEFLC